MTRQITKKSKLLKLPEEQLKNLMDWASTRMGTTLEEALDILIQSEEDTNITVEGVIDTVLTVEKANKL